MKFPHCVIDQQKLATLQVQSTNALAYFTCKCDMNTKYYQYISLTVSKIYCIVQKYIFFSQCKDVMALRHTPKSLESPTRLIVQLENGRYFIPRPNGLIANRRPRPFPTDLISIQCIELKNKKSAIGKRKCTCC